MKRNHPLDGFEVDRASIRKTGHDLQRPECILAERDGTLWAADARGGVKRVAPDGSQRFIGQQADERFSGTSSTDAFEAKFTQGTLSNGLAFAANGDILISNSGTDWLEAMTRDGRTRTLFDSIDGQPMRKMNDGTATASDMQRTRGSIAPWMASVTFGGPDLKTVYLGSLQGTTIPSFRRSPACRWRTGTNGTDPKRPAPDSEEQAMLELYNAAISTCSQKVRMALAELARMWSDLPRVTDWYRKLQARPAFALTYYPGTRNVGPGC